jgi:hypothetical protein
MSALTDADRSVIAAWRDLGAAVAMQRQARDRVDGLKPDAPERAMREAILAYTTGLAKRAEADWVRAGVQAMASQPL